MHPKTWQQSDVFKIFLCPSSMPAFRMPRTLTKGLTARMFAVWHTASCILLNKSEAMFIVNKKPAKTYPPIKESLPKTVGKILLNSLQPCGFYRDAKSRIKESLLSKYDKCSAATRLFLLLAHRHPVKAFSPISSSTAVKLLLF